MTINDWIKRGAAELSWVSPTPKLDAEVLLASNLQKDRAWLYAHPEEIINKKKLIQLKEWLRKRCAHEPVAHIVQKCEFYRREFFVDKRVLVPRPESETMIDLLKQVVSSEKLEVRNGIQIIDVGTGSGALGITAALELSLLNPIPYPLPPTLIDIDKKCLEVAKVNSQKHNIAAKFLHGNLLEPLASYPLPLTSYPLILANLPYVPNDYALNNAAMNEPKQAIFGGVDGLDLYRNMFEQLTRIGLKTRAVFTESLPFQHSALRQIAAEHHYKQVEGSDFIQVFAAK